MQKLQFQTFLLRGEIYQQNDLIIRSLPSYVLTPDPTEYARKYHISMLNPLQWGLDGSRWISARQYLLTSESGYKGFFLSYLEGGWTIALKTSKFLHFNHFGDFISSSPKFINQFMNIFQTFWLHLQNYQYLNKFSCSADISRSNPELK